MPEPLFPGVGEELLGSDQRAFFLEVCQMLEYHGAAGSARVRTSGRLERFRGADQLLLELTESEGALAIEASASEGEIIIAMGDGDAWNSHWHFAPTWNDVFGNVPDRAWTSLAVDFLAELVQGEVRVRVLTDIQGEDGGDTFDEDERS